MAAFRAFFATLGSRLKKSQIQSSPFTGKDSSGFKRECRGIVFAEKEADVLFVLRTAAKFLVPLSPVSSGLNAGYGDFYPYRRSHVILHLGKMNRILELNREEGWLRIQPGVTQAQLSAYVTENAPEYFFAQTFWLGESSVLGNSLERGRTLFGERERNLIGAKLAIPSGKLLRTGFDPEMPSPLAQGMNLHPLIFQSNLGVAVEGVVKLEKRNLREICVSLQTSSYNQGLKELETLRSCPVKLLRWYEASGRQGRLVLSLDRAELPRLRKMVSLPLRRIEDGALSGSAEISGLQEHGAFAFFTFSVRNSRVHFEKAQELVMQIRKLARHCSLTVSFLESSAVFLLRVHTDPSLHEDIHRKVSAAGFRSYRGHSAHLREKSRDLALKKRIKKCFDPKNVISPGKYGLL